eukprot:CAMPEP_0196595772 /NCGR_PEP_ID=MMETSP1081-20130531/82356_1 /TAXON_ID=36882 /ORGANISM="Pyramimonas amylifera, Strain CCMP720" /LENGTH=208 /DNA_ID=CAMNT_0041920481 /DNA_START=136 /DNA_END=759 /DNA_ORIENTATION=-
MAPSFYTKNSAVNRNQTVAYGRMSNRQSLRRSDATLDYSRRTLMSEAGPSFLNYPDIVFVFTDIEDSVKMANIAPQLYKHAHNIHDSVIRTQLSLMNGFEVNTQGDSFELALPTVEAAMVFCMDVQNELMQANWGDGVLRKLPLCAPIYSPQGHLQFRGVRVRMGIHLAKAGSFEKRTHTLTKHIQFEGVGYKFGLEVADSAAGGQIV